MFSPSVADDLTKRGGDCIQKTAIGDERRSCRSTMKLAEAPPNLTVEAVRSRCIATPQTDDQSPERLGGDRVGTRRA